MFGVMKLSMWVISHFVTWTSLSQLSYYNGAQKCKINKEQMLV
jgi:hypothetical protein